MEYLIMVLVVGIFGIVILIMYKKESNILNQFLANLTENEKKLLEDNQVTDYNDKKHTWIQRGMIAQVTKKGDSVYLKVLWYNTIINNATINKCQYADIKMKKSEFESRNLKKGDFVKIFIDPRNKAKII